MLFFNCFTSLGYIMNEDTKLKELFNINSSNSNYEKRPNVLENEYMALVNIILSSIVR